MVLTHGIVTKHIYKLFAIHLLTPEGRARRNHDPAAAQYRELTQFGSAGPLYFPVTGGSPESFARTVGDLRLGLAALAAPDARDPWWVPAPLDGPKVPRRAALCCRPDGLATVPEVEAALRDAARRLEAAFEPDAPPSDPARIGRLVAELTDVIERFDRDAPAATVAPVPTRRRSRTVAVVGFAQRQMKEFDGSPTCVELLVPLFAEAYEQTGWTRKDVGFWCSGSSDYLAGRSFSFVQAVDAIGVIPPVNESHVEMDLAWAMYEAWLKIQTGEVDTALVYGFGKSSAGQLRRVLSLQLDPYLTGPLWPDTVSLAGLQARAGIDRGVWDERAMAEVAHRSLTDAEKNEYAVRKGGSSVEELLAKFPLGDRPGLQEELVGEGALAVVDMGHDREVADEFRVNGHGGSRLRKGERRGADGGRLRRGTVGLLPS